MKTAIATQPEDQPINIVRVSDIEKTASHIAILLKITEQCGHFLAHPDSFNERIDVDEVAKVEARKTFELAHIRLRDLIDEEKRWNLSASPNERESSEVLRSTIKLTDAKRENIEAYNRPCVFLRAQIRRLPDETWCVWIGGPEPRGWDLHGTGPSPEKAMAAFDKEYSDLKKYTPQQPEDMPLPPMPEPEKKPKRKKT